jgi:protein TonB
MSQQLHNNAPELKKRISMPVIYGFVFMGAVMVCLPLLQYMIENTGPDTTIVEPPDKLPPPTETEFPPPPDPPEPDDKIDDLEQEKLKPTLKPAEWIFDRPDMSGVDGSDWTVPDPTTSLVSGIIEDIGQLSKAPRALRAKTPVFPNELRRNGISGVVYVSYVVRDDGTTSHIRILRSTHQAFSEAAIRAIRKWIFQPGEKDGKKVNARVRQSIPFNIN